MHITTELLQSNIGPNITEDKQLDKGLSPDYENTMPPQSSLISNNGLVFSIPHSSFIYYTGRKIKHMFGPWYTFNNVVDKIKIGEKRVYVENFVPSIGGCLNRRKKESWCCLEVDDTTWVLNLKGSKRSTLFT